MISAAQKKSREDKIPPGFRHLLSISSKETLQFAELQLFDIPYDLIEFQQYNRKFGQPAKRDLVYGNLRFD